VGTDETQHALGERSFGIDELFFSTTDPGGRIASGNPVFVRVSGYSAEDLQGRPHNIVRHPDTPRVVFRLLWRYLGESRPIAAYVQNRAKNGQPYWVVATVVPIPGGYLSVRFKPTGPHFALIQGLYGELAALERQLERDGGSRDEAIAAAEERLQHALEGLGLHDYDAFMHRFLADEMRSREAALSENAEWRARWAGRPAPAGGDARRATLIEILGGFRAAHAWMDERFADVEDYVRLNEALGSRSRDLVGEMRLQSLNMLLAASSLGDGGASLAVVARLMGTEASAATALADALNGRGDALDGVLRELGFRISIGRLQAEMAVFFAHEMLQQADAAGAADRGEVAGNLELLSVALSESLRHIERSSHELERALGEMDGDIVSLSNLLDMLDALQLNGTIEAARIGGAETATQLLAEMRQRVRASQVEIDGLAGVAGAARARARRGGDEGLGAELERIGQRARSLAA
jgi:aerotaxis receptor